MQLLVVTTIALAGLVLGYGFGLGGTIAFLIFLGILFVGIVMRAAQPLIDRLAP